MAFTRGAGLVSRAYWKAYFARMASRKYWGELDEFSRLDPPAQKRAIAHRMASQIQYFGNRADALPEWTEVARINDLDEVWEAWSSLPILTKNELQEKFVPEEIRDRFGIDGVINQTGGSTGEPTRFIWDNASLLRRAASQYYCWLKFGWTPATAILCFWGSPQELGAASSRTSKLINRFKNLELIGGFAFDDSTFNRAMEYLEKNDRVCIYGYSSLLEQFAFELQDRGLRLQDGKVSAVWNGAEGLLPGQSELFTEVSGKPIQNQYGSREFGALGYQASGSDGLQLLRPNAFIELVNDEGLPCGPGEVGRIIVTTLINKGTPFLRYENGDLGMYAENGASESGIVKLASIEGRKSGVIRVKSGKVVHNSFWGMLFKEFPAVRQFQVRQAKDQSIRILLRGPHMSEQDEARLKQLLANTIAPLHVELEWVDSIPLTRQGKLIQVHSELASSQEEPDPQLIVHTVRSMTRIQG